MYINDEREAFFVDAHRKYHSKMENVCRAYVQYNEEYRSLIDESIQETYLRRDLSRSVFAKQCAIRIDKQQKERYNNVVIDNDVII